MVRHQADLVSPERQTHACKLWLEMHGSDYTIEWFEDVEGHKSGRHEEGRPGWQELLKQLERPEVAGVIVDSIDRAYRNVHEFLQFLNLLERLNKTLVSHQAEPGYQLPDGPSDCHHPDGDLPIGERPDFRANGCQCEV